MFEYLIPISVHKIIYDVGKYKIRWLLSLPNSVVGLYNQNRQNYGYWARSIIHAIIFKRYLRLTLITQVLGNNFFLINDALFRFTCKVTWIFAHIGAHLSLLDSLQGLRIPFKLAIGKSSLQFNKYKHHFYLFFNLLRYLLHFCKYRTYFFIFNIF